MTARPAFVVVSRLPEEADVDEAIILARDLEAAGSTAVIAGSRGLDPVALLAAIAASTERIGLAASLRVADASPYSLARRLASLDHLSGGRAAWLPASGSPLTEEVVEATRALWDSVADDAFPRDKASGVYVRREGRRQRAHRGAQLASDGPLNLSRPPQGRPVTVLPADSPLVVTHADVALVPPADPDEAEQRRRGIDEALSAAGRAPGSLRIWVALPEGPPEWDGLRRAYADGAIDGVIIDAAEASRVPPEVHTAHEAATRPANAAPTPTLRETLGLPRPWLTIDALGAA